MVRFSVNPNLPNPNPGHGTEPLAAQRNLNPGQGTVERFAAQLALARVHPELIPLERVPGGYAIPRDETRGWFELRAKRGLAGYGLARALRMLLDVLGGLSALEDTRTAKGQPFVHGELVPAMMRVDPAGITRLIPLAPWHWSAPGTLPAPERYGHLAPERLLGDVIDARADVFSAGALLWEALAGRRLFETDSVDGIVTRLMGKKLTLPELPPELGWAAPLKAVAMCALSVDPEQRFANCAELAEAITAVAGDRVATHSDVADYFRGPDLAVRPSVIAHSPTLPAHHSSLSALIAPLVPSEPAEHRPSAPIRGESWRPERRVSRSVWAIAALSCVVGAVGASAIGRYGGMQGERHGAFSSAPTTGVPLASVTPQPVASASPSPAAVPPEAAPAVIAPALSVETRDKPPKPTRPSHIAKPTSAKPRPPVKAVRSPDKAAAKYGI